MRKNILLVLIVLTLSVVSFGQHCPYDGSHLVVVHLTDADNLPVMNAAITLQEIDNPEADSCSYSKGLLAKSFMRVQDLLDTSLLVDPGKSITERYCADCGFLGDGYYGASLTQSEQSCMIDKGTNDFRYRKRKFEIHAGDKIFEVEGSKIYSLCFGTGKWSRIQPIEISLFPNAASGQISKSSDIEEDKCCDFSKYDRLIQPHTLYKAALKKVDPEYPQVARNVRANGKVVVRILVDQKGDVVKACVLEGHPLLRRAALEAAEQWKFKKNFGFVASKLKQNFAEIDLTFNFQFK